MRVLLRPRPLAGKLAAIPAKSQAHRLLICAALADQATFISPDAPGQDIAATQDCLSQLGASFVNQAGGLSVMPLSSAVTAPCLDCRESGATLRFMLPLAAVLAEQAAFTARGRLPLRPLSELMRCLSEHGLSFSAAKPPFSMQGRLRGGCFSLPGHISSQYISGLLLALPLAEQGSEIILSTPLSAPGYVQMTLEALSQFNIIVEQHERGFFIPGAQRYHSPGALELTGDWSNAAFFLAAGALAGPVCISGLDSASPQPDKAILPLLTSFGAQVEEHNGSVTVRRGDLRGQEIDVSAIIDLAPALGVLGALSRGRTVLKNAARLRAKESDRLRSLCALLSSLGARVIEHKDGLSIEGQERLVGGLVRGYGDHRMVMAAALAASACEHDVVISGAEAHGKSYPAFFDHYRALGGEAYDVRLG